MAARTAAPGAAAAPPTTSAPPSTPSTPAASRTYVIVSGDTLTDVAVRFGIPWEQIAAANNLTPPYTVRAGQVLTIPGTTTTSTSTLAPSATRTYVVTSTDTLSDIGERFSVPWERIAAANNIAPPYVVRAGQVLTIPAS